MAIEIWWLTFNESGFALNLSINALETELEAAADFCREQSLGIELAAFAFPHMLASRYSESIGRHAASVVGISPVTVHGPFLDLYPASPDPEVAAVARRRHSEGLNAATA